MQQSTLNSRARLKNILSSPGARQFIKFALVGCINVGISTVVFFLCYEKWHLASSILHEMGQKGAGIVIELERLGIQSVDGAFATTIGYTAGTVNSYLLNRSLTFGVRTNTWRQVRRFVLLNILGLFISTLIMFVFVDLMMWPYMAVWVATVTLVMIFNFVGNKYWTFTQQEK